MSNINNFHILQKLGEGAFSQVFKVRRKSDGSEYAMKKVKLIKLSEKEKQNALNEVRILASIQHPNIIAYKEAFIEDSSSCLCIIMELADGGDLLKQIENHKKRKTFFTEKEIWYCFIQMVRGVKALHDLKICHRDIKCANVFLTKNNVVKLGDLNVSKVVKKGLLHTQTGTPYYASPEVWKDKPYDYKSDVWSLGCVLYEMIALNPPFRAANMNGLYQRVLKGMYDPIPSQFSIDLKMMVKSCLQVSPIARPNCEKILRLPGLLNHLTGTLEDLDQPNEGIGLLNTIKVPRNIVQIGDNLPKPQYQMKRTNSLPGRMDQLPEINKKDQDNNIQQAQNVIHQNSQIPGGLANRIIKNPNNLAVIQENPIDYNSIESSRQIQQKIKERVQQSLSPKPYDYRTPQAVQQKTKKLINYQQRMFNDGPKIQQTNAQETGISMNLRLPKIGRNQENINPNPIYMNRGEAYKRHIYRLRQNHDDYQQPTHKRGINRSLDSNNIYQSRIF